MPIKITITREEVKRLYDSGDFSMNDLAKHFGCTRSAIWYHLHPKKQITVAHPVKIICDGCNKEFTLKRRRGRPGRLFFCGSPCQKPTASKEVWRTLATEILE